jgi:hypothetical protein
MGNCSNKTQKCDTQRLPKTSLQVDIPQNRNNITVDAPQPVKKKRRGRDRKFRDEYTRDRDQHTLFD